jgi:hypothetical protein
MTNARSRSRFSPGRPTAVPRVRRSPSVILIILARTGAAGVLIGGIAAASRFMYSLSWRADGAIALLVATGWILCAELLLGGL